MCRAAGSGVCFATVNYAVRAAATEMLGNTLVTIQTGEHGKQVNRLYVTDGVDIAQEFYLALLVNRATGKIGMVVSTEGGMDIEAVAHDTPEKIQTLDIDPATGELWGNYPQTYSLVGLINCAVLLSKPWSAVR